MAIRAPIAAEVDDDASMTRRGAFQRIREVGFRLFRVRVDRPSREGHRLKSDREEGDQRNYPKFRCTHARHYYPKRAARREAPITSKAGRYGAGGGVATAAVSLMALIGVGAAAAASDLRWKLTAGEYAYADYAGTDLNLRWRDEGTDAWVGVYEDRVFGTQGRVGTDTVFDVAKYVHVQPSLQLATGGFAGGSVNVQAGGSWYGMAGIGRTDGRPYFNLNFDPNDAVTLGGGHQGADGYSYLVFVVADNRFHTGQRDWHFNAQIPFGDSHATFDLLRKSGLSDAGPIAAWGFSANYDWPGWFLRLAYDPYQNFSAHNVWRFAGGLRF